MRWAKDSTLTFDRGGDYTSKAFEAFLEKSGVAHELPAPYSQWQNGIAERSNRTLKEMARAMMIATYTPVIFWHRAIAIAVYLLNNMPTSALPTGLTPYEALYRRRPSTETVHPFGCDVFVTIPDNKRTAFDETSKPCFYLGPIEGTSDMFQYFNPATREIGVSRDGIFVDNISGTCKRRPLLLEEVDRTFGGVNTAVVIDPPLLPMEPIINVDATGNTNTNVVTEDPIVGASIQETVTYDQVKRVSRPSVWLRDYAYSSVLASDVDDEQGTDMACIISPDGQRTFTLAEVQHREDWPLLEEAMRVELDAIEKNET